MRLKNRAFMKNTVKQITSLSLALFTVVAVAKENVNFSGYTSTVTSKVAAGCDPSTSQTDLDVNNVRTTIMGGGDMWWNLSDPQYEVPKGGNKHSMFAGALWIGGVDDGGQLKVAGMTYRQSGNDFWPGPLNIDNGTISSDECTKWDDHFKLNRSEVEEHVARMAANDPTYVIPESISEWPAHGDQSLGQDEFLAPFYDANDNGLYEPFDGDYPDYNITGNNDNAGLFGDQTLFWIFNDKGNIHSETDADALGLEIHAQAFGFTADNEVNDMTFYNYKIINRSTLPLNDTYFGQWVDPDLGYYLDDYVGCDVNLGLGFCYNGDAEDEGASGYGFNPPAIGVDFFQGPIADANDGLDNDRDGVTDEAGEQIIMSKFVYYNNDQTVQGNPSGGTDFYNYLRGIWRDNVPMTYGGNGKGGGSGATTDECNFMFPGTSDDAFPGQEWTEQTAGNIPADRRFLQSAGPFTLQPGAVNEITTGVVWARAKTGGQTASVQLLKIYDREAQALFDNNFNILNGPDAPDLTIRELDKELIFTLSNGETSNNINESYSEKDPYITKPVNLANSPNYEFQGYLVYQLKNATVSVTDLNDPASARLIYRSDINDTVSGIVNQYLDPILGVYTPIEEVASVLSEGVVGSVDDGIQYSFQITEDKFATGSTRLVNHKTYYFMSIAYGYNRAEENSSPYAVSDPDYDGRNQPYIAGRRNIKVYSAIPHFTEPDAGGTTLSASYGDGVKITRIEGTGNGGGSLEFTAETVDEILSSEDHRSLNPTYEAGQGPVNISVVDPVKIPEGTFVLKLQEPSLTNLGVITNYNKWTLHNEETGAYVASGNFDIGADFSGKSSKYVKEIGLNINVSLAQNPGQDPDNIDNNGLIEGSIEFSDENDRWLSGLADLDDSFGGTFWGLNWIRAGNYEDENFALLSDYNLEDDPNGIYESVVVQTNTTFGGLEATGGTWAPYSFASYMQDGPGFNSTVTNSYVKFENLSSVDVVFKPCNKVEDGLSIQACKEKYWSKVCVVEAQDDPALAIGGQVKMGLRKSPSLDINGDLVNDGTEGMSYFPGYAVDLETGERLNIIFAEDSWQTSENGADMLWNPTSRIVTDEFPQYDPQTGEFSGGSYLIGGKHFIYVVNGSSLVKGNEDYINGNLTDVNVSPSYDEGAWIHAKLSSTPLLSAQFDVFENIGWVGVPLLAPGRELLTSDARVKLRVTKPYNHYETVSGDQILSNSADLVIGESYTVAYYFPSNTYPQGTWGGKSVTHDGVVYEVGETFIATTTSFSGSSKARVIAANALNSFNPMYRFNTEDIVAEQGNIEVAQDAMELIRAVPNPYYAKSDYETNQLDNRIKITNLPQEAMISIFTVSGTLVRTIKKDDNVTSVDWDLKNDYGIPISSGLYVIHVRGKFWDADAKEFVEKDKVIKWFGALRPIDLDTF